MTTTRSIRAAGLIFAALLAHGCATATRRKAVPVNQQTTATVAGFPYGIRYFPRDGARLDVFKKDFVESWARERAVPGHPGPYRRAAAGRLPRHLRRRRQRRVWRGLLDGWTKAGTRPTFKLVTGVSTGALIAPFAFLGPAYDEQLKAMYTAVSMKDIAAQRWILSVLFGDAMADTTPLWNLLEESHHPGDARRHRGRVREGPHPPRRDHEPGRSAPGHLEHHQDRGLAAPGALELVQKILLASAAIPGRFRPS